MTRIAGLLACVGATVATLIGVLPLQSVSARPQERLSPSRASSIAELQKIRRLPKLQADRIRIADLAATLVRPDAPAFVRHVLHAQLIAPPFVAAPRRFLRYPPFTPQPRRACRADTIYSSGAFPAVIAKNIADADPAGCVGTYLPDGPVTASTHPFFQSLGTNGRSCATCHQPPSGMSVSRANIAARLQATSGSDSLFAGVDGANCPNNLPAFSGTGAAFKAAHSLLLNRGLFRVFLPLPAGAEFTVTAVDPYGCNTTAPWNTDTVNGQTAQMISVYRRPRISANLNFIDAFLAPGTFPAIMWDTRETSLRNQIIDATHGHAQGTVPPTTAQVDAMLQFELRLFSAQSRDTVALGLNAGGATGGPVALSSIVPSTTPAGTPAITFDEYNAWSGLFGSAAAARRASIARGQKLFNTKTFTISNVAGLNDVPGLPNPFTGTCSGCHSQPHAGNDELGNIAVLDIGVDGGSVAHNGNPLSAVLPIFTVTCTGGKSTPFNGSTVTTNDLGLALITGKCADIGKYTVPQLRAVGAHAPFFHDGSAKTLWDVVAFYNKRFNIKLTYQQQQDLTNFLAAL